MTNQWSELPGRRRFLRAMAALPLGPVAMGAANATAPARRPIPASGELLPVLGLGTYDAFDFSAGDGQAGTDATATLRSFLVAGGRLIDSSPMYGEAEARIGDILAALAAAEKPFLATKVWTRGEAAGRAQMERSFRLLRTDRIDLMQVHNLVDVATHLKTLAEWKRQGRVRYVGITHYDAGAYAEVEAWLRRGGLDFLQINYSVAEREAEDRLLPLCRERGIAVVANRPFAKGGLFSRIRGRPLPPWAPDIGCGSWAQLFLKWILGNPAVTCVIPATRNPAHVEDNLRAGSEPWPDEAMRRRIAAAVAGA